MNANNETTNSTFYIENLKKGTATGVLEVISFSPTEILLRIESGKMEICGSALEVKAFNTQTGELAFEGGITSVALKQNKTSFWERISK
ncbi:MAG: YabP/YqfC family sporulation protein [Bacillota bacterium]